MDTWRAAYGGIVPDDYLMSLSYEELERRWRDIIAAGDGCVFVAEGAQGVFGFASGQRRRRFSRGLKGYEGELKAVYVLPPARVPAQAGGSWARSPGISRSVV